jgi:hypothetical protein
MSNRTNIAAASKNILFVPLCKLKKSPKNVRKVPHTKADIKTFAASIAGPFAPDGKRTMTVAARPTSTQR